MYKDERTVMSDIPQANMSDVANTALTQITELTAKLMQAESIIKQLHENNNKLEKDLSEVQTELSEYKEVTRVTDADYLNSLDPTTIPSISVDNNE
jgi:phage shock protein A